MCVLPLLPRNRLDDLSFLSLYNYKTPPICVFRFAGSIRFCVVVLSARLVSARQFLNSFSQSYFMLFFNFLFSMRIVTSHKAKFFHLIICTDFIKRNVKSNNDPLIKLAYVSFRNSLTYSIMILMYNFI